MTVLLEAPVGTGALLENYKRAPGHFVDGEGVYLIDENGKRYLDFVTTFMFWVGITFELPIVMYFLSKLGVVSAQRMGSFRKYAFVLAFVFGAVANRVSFCTMGAISDIVNLYYYIWREAGGDVRSASSMRTPRIIQNAN